MHARPPYISQLAPTTGTGMFIIRVSCPMDLLKEYKPELAEGLTRITAVWDVDEVQRNKVLEEVWPLLSNDHRPRCCGPNSAGTFATYNLHISGEANLLHRLG